MVIHEIPSITSMDEITRIEKIALVKLKPDTGPSTVSNYFFKIAKLGVYFSRASDAPPGNTVMWRGFSKLKNIVLGIEIRK